MNAPTRFIYNLISDVAELWIEFFSNIQNTILPLIIEIISFLLWYVSNLWLSGYLPLLFQLLLFFIKYKLIKDRQKYDKESKNLRNQFYNLK